MKRPPRPLRGLLGLLRQDAPSGAVYVFKRAAAAWSQQTYIKASNAATYSVFGSRLALSADGNTLAVGAEAESGGAIGLEGDQGDQSTKWSGAVYVFEQTGDAWSQRSYVKPPNTSAYHRFGASIALSAEGSILAIGADGDGSNATGINGSQDSKVSASAGAAYVY